jgi:hypothetical protein
MIQAWQWLQMNRRLALLAIVFFLGFIAFEARQQLFYAENFNNGQTVDVGFWYFLKTGMYRWLIWIALAIPAVLFLIRNRQRHINAKTVFIYGSLIVILMLLNLVLVSMVNAWSSDDFYASFSEAFGFYFFHKAPIILASLVFLILLIEFCLKREALQLSIEELGSLRYTNEQLYEQIKDESLRDETMVIQVKVGNRVKLVPLDTIVWIEADDYCVRIHDQSGRGYTLRSTMKSLEEKLPQPQFLRVHRKAMVNLSAVKEYVFGAKPMIVMNEGTEIPLAQSRVKDVRSLLQSTW